MRVPHSIPDYAFEAFRCSDETLLLPCEAHRTLRSENQDWDPRSIGPLDLKTLSLRVIADNWRKNPILEELPTPMDRDHLLEIMPIDIDFELAITKIPYEHFWQRSAEARWKVNDPADYGNSWRRLYCERHLWQYLETLDPTYFESVREECEKLLDLVHEHVHVLRLRQLLPAKPTEIPRLSKLHEPPTPLLIEKPEVNHIPMDMILAKLPYLREIDISIDVISLSEDFDLRDFEFSVDDSRNIGQGVKELAHLIKFSVTRSNMTQQRAAAILHGLGVNNNIREIDFSHCKLKDQGALAVAAYLEQRSVNSRVRSLTLCNNNIGPEGLSGLVRSLILSQRDRPSIRRLNLRFNPIGDKGAAYFGALFLRYTTLEYLNISGCGIGPEGGMKMMEVLASGHTNFSNIELDLSNNNLGPIVGKAFQAAVKSCSSITEIDVRMCRFEKDSEVALMEIVQRNRENIKEPMKKKSIFGNIQREKSLVPPERYVMFQRPRQYIYTTDGDDNDDGGEEDTGELM